MFIYNVKLNGNTILKTIFIIVAIIIIILFGIAAYNVFTKSISSGSAKDEMDSSGIAMISPENYTNILRSVHDDLDQYVGQKICFTGYVYRVEDLETNQFVLARDMVISSNFQTLVVGFLCNSDQASKYQDKTWVQITGTITKGIYHGEIPEIKVTEIKQVDKPTDEYVYPPDDSYIPTAVLY